jgi:hypothetical protein
MEKIGGKVRDRGTGTQARARSLGRDAQKFSGDCTPLRASAAMPSLASASSCA